MNYVVCDKLGWPVEYTIGRPIQRILRYIIHGRKLKRRPLTERELTAFATIVIEFAHLSPPERRNVLANLGERLFKKDSDK